MTSTDSDVNPEKRAGHDDANAEPGSGASGPGDRAFDHESQVSGDGGEAIIDAEAKAAAGEDPAAKYLDE